MTVKVFVTVVIFLFIGVAIAPSINFNVVKASNDNDLVEVTTSDEQTYHTTEEPRVAIYNLSGGYGVHATLQNCWDEDLANVNWSISITGGRFNLIHKVKSDTIPIFHPNQVIIISSGILFGWGSTEIYVTADLNGVHRSGTQRLFRTGVHNLPDSS